jgi:hypothetical protein
MEEGESIFQDDIQSVPLLICDETLLLAGLRPY